MQLGGEVILRHKDATETTTRNHSIVSNFGWRPPGNEVAGLQNNAG